MLLIACAALHRSASIEAMKMGHVTIPWMGDAIHCGRIVLVRQHSDLMV